MFTKTIMAIAFQISRGADINKRDINEMTCLMWAAIEGHVAVINVLLKSGTTT